MDRLSSSPRPFTRQGSLHTVGTTPGHAHHAQVTPLTRVRRVPLHFEDLALASHSCHEKDTVTRYDTSRRY